MGRKPRSCASLIVQMVTFDSQPPVTILLLVLSSGFAETTSRAIALGDEHEQKIALYYRRRAGRQLNRTTRLQQDYRESAD